MIAGSGECGISAEIKWRSQEINLISDIFIYVNESAPLHFVVGSAGAVQEEVLYKPQVGDF